MPSKRSLEDIATTFWTVRQAALNDAGYVLTMTPEAIAIERKVLMEALAAETERCRDAVCPMCANGDEYNEGHHHFGMGGKKVCHAAAIREERDE